MRTLRYCKLHFYLYSQWTKRNKYIDHTFDFDATY